jgi:hypothetical protein
MLYVPNFNNAITRVYVPTIVQSIAKKSSRYIINQEHWMFLFLIHVN